MHRTPWKFSRLARIAWKISRLPPTLWNFSRLTSAITTISTSQNPCDYGCIKNYSFLKKPLKLLNASQHQKKYSTCLIKYFSLPLFSSSVRSPAARELRPHRFPSTTQHSSVDLIPSNRLTHAARYTANYGSFKWSDHRVQVSEKQPAEAKPYP